MVDCRLCCRASALTNQFFSLQGFKRVEGPIRVEDITDELVARYATSLPYALFRKRTLCFLNVSLGRPLPRNVWLCSVVAIEPENAAPALFYLAHDALHRTFFLPIHVGSRIIWSPQKDTFLEVYNNLETWMLTFFSKTLELGLGCCVKTYGIPERELAVAANLRTRKEKTNMSACEVAQAVHLYWNEVKTMPTTIPALDEFVERYSARTQRRPRCDLVRLRAICSDATIDVCQLNTGVRCFLCGTAFTLATRTVFFVCGHMLHADELCSCVNLVALTGGQCPICVLTRNKSKKRKAVEHEELATKRQALVQEANADEANLLLALREEELVREEESVRREAGHIARKKEAVRASARRRKSVQ